MTNDNWYNKLSQEPEFITFLKSSNIAATELENGKCVSLTHKNDHDDPFELRIGECQEKKRAVCRNEKPKSVSGGNPTMFPCVTAGQKRKKREGENDEERDKPGKNSNNMTNLAFQLF